MFQFVSMNVFFYYLIASFLCFNLNYIHAYHLRETPDLLEEYYRSRGPPFSNDDTDSEVIWLNPGVLSNMKEFFDNLSSNMDSINEEKSAIHEIEADQPLKIKNPLTENYFRGYKPSYKIRNYVQSPDLGLLKGTNHHDPSLKWTGLGKRSL